MAKRGTEDKRKEEFKDLAGKSGDRFYRLFDSFSAFDPHSRRQIKIPAQGCDAILLFGGTSVGVQLEFKSIEGADFSLTRLADDQLKSLVYSADKSIQYFIIIDFVCDGTVFHVPVSAKFWVDYDSSKSSRPRSSMTLHLYELPEGLQKFSKISDLYCYIRELVTGVL